MARPPATLDRARLRETLITVLNHMLPTCAQIEYRLVGTGAALLHGVELPAADVDILVRDRADVDAIGAALSALGCLSTPAWLPEAAQYYANYDVNGVEVGISTVEVESDADTIETFGPGPWERFTPLPCGPYLVPTVSLELRLITELFRGRPDRYRPILQHLQAHACDTDFVARGMAAAGLPPDVQEDVLTQLKGAPVSQGDQRVGRI